MRFYKDRDPYVYNDSLYDKQKKRKKYETRIISVFLAFGIMINGINISNITKYELSHSNPFKGQSISSSDFSSNYKAIRSRSFIEDENFKDTIEYIKNANIDEKKAYLLYYALLSNEYLANEEKEKLTGYIQYFIDNKYLDYEYVYNKLSSFIIKEDDETLLSEGIAGTYNQTDNSLTFGGKSSRDYSMSHEVGHSEDKFLYLNSSANYKWFTEGLTDLLSYEYNNTTIAYDVEVTFCRILCEFVGSDVLFKTRAKGDINILINALVNRGIGKEKVNELFALFNDYRWERKKENPDFDSLRIKIIDLLRDCYLDISKNDEFVNPMFYQHILYISKLQNCDSNIKYYFNTKKINEMGIPTASEEFYLAKTDEIINYNSQKNVMEKTVYYDNYKLKIREVIQDNIISTDTSPYYLTKEEFNFSIDGIISEIKERQNIK